MPPIATILPEKWPQKELNSLKDGTCPSKYQSQPPHESVPFHIHPVAGGPGTDHSPFPPQEPRVLPQGVSIKLLLLPGIEPASQTDYSLSESPGKEGSLLLTQGRVDRNRAERWDSPSTLKSPRLTKLQPWEAWDNMKLMWIVLLTSTLAVWQ